MPSKYLSQLSKEEYANLTQELHRIQNGRCFICGQEIDLDVQTTNIDHIIPLASRGRDDKSNFALTHEVCNKAKQDANLRVARALAHLKVIQDNVSASEKRAASLKDLLSSEGGSLYDFSCNVKEDELVYSFNELGDVTVYKSRIFTPSAAIH